MKTVLNEMIEKQETPSVQYMIAEEDSILVEFNKCNSNLENNELTDTSSRYNIFSVTKTFTAIAIMQLQEKKLLSIDDKLDKYLPEYPWLKDISIKDLLCHQSGIKNPIPIKWIHLKSETFDFDKWTKSIINNNRKLKWEPGTDFSYSNIGYLILGEVIEKVSKQSYDNYIRTEIIEKIQNIEYLDFETPTENYATGYQKRNFMSFLLNFLFDKKKYTYKANSKWLGLHPYGFNGKSYGGLISNAQSLTRYMQTLLEDNSPLLNNGTKNLLLTEQNNYKSEPTGMALGWFTGNLNGHNYFCHAGGGVGYYCEIRIYPELKISSVIIMNRSGMKDERILDKLDLKYLKK
ncbi:MAG: beta-lactamase family protein [Bacteroidales bacterium]|nr:beta-lactamase family protein [Bacteroidales bacterium]